jgi:multiple sugar transport system permease protein
MIKTNSKSKGLPIGARRAIAYVVLILISFLCIVWFYILFINATRSKGELTRGFTPVPSTHLIENLMDGVFHGTLPFVSGMLNSLFIAGCSAALCTYFSTMTAYAIHVYDFKLKKPAFVFIMLILVMPTQVSAMGFLNIITKLGMLNTLYPLILPSIAAPAVFYFMYSYMQSSLPMELVEAARIDGCNEFKIFNTIVIPIMKPAIAVQAIFQFVFNWNNYFIPALVLQDNNKRTLPILIAMLRSADFLKFDMGKVYMLITIAIVPIIIVYIMLSRYIVAGVAIGGVKE